MNVKKVKVDDVVSQIKGKEVVVGIDIAKTDMVAAVSIERRQAVVTLKWKHPKTSGRFLSLLTALREASSKLVVALEPTGTYGDALWVMMLNQGFEVHRVSPLRVNHSVEAFDGVPSSHDGKTAAIIAKLVQDGASQLWALPRKEQRALIALSKSYDLSHQQYLDNLNRLEAELARYWPEVLELVSLKRVSLWRLLSQLGGPEQIVSQREEAAKVLRNAGGALLAPERIDAILDAAKDSCGVPICPEELQWLQLLASDIDRAHQACVTAARKLRAAGRTFDTVNRMAEVVGELTAAVLIAKVGVPTDYACASAYEKAIGLNLRERSSGKHKGEMRLTKRGSGRARQLLFLAAMRLKKTNSYVNAWVEARPNRGRGWKLKALVGVMRKLAKALWHVAAGKTFKIEKFIDVTRLQVAA